jgi:hypothetical protein
MINNLLTDKNNVDTLVDMEYSEMLAKLQEFRGGLVKTV